MLDHRFDAATLSPLRERVLAVARSAGMPGGRAVDLMLALHELAANAVRHGAGSGWLRITCAEGALYCAVTDAGAVRPRGVPAVTRAAAEPWPYEPGHGLWLVRQAADHVSVVTGPAGSEVTAVFVLAEPSGAED